MFWPGLGPPAAPHHASALFAINGLQAQNLELLCAAIVHFCASGVVVTVGVFSVKSPFIIAALGACSVNTLSEM